MGSLILKVIRGLVRLIAKLHPKLPQILELDLKHVQGKGIGAGSVELEAKSALEFLKSLGIEKPIVIDVGANNGNYSEEVLKLNSYARIFAFEPSQKAREFLGQKFKDDSRVKIISSALGKTESKKTLWSDVAGSGLASLTKRRLEHFGIEFNHSEEVEVTTLDKWIEFAQINPNLIKIDVEGHELDVLKGGLKTLSVAQVIQFEFGGCNIDTRTFFQDFWYLLTPLGFTIYRIAKTRPIQIVNYSEEDEYFMTTNYLAVRNS